MTIMKDIKMISPGILYEIDIQNNKIKKKKLESIINIFNYNKKNSKKKVSEFFQESVTSHLASDVKIGLFLSSGVDSILIAKILKSRPIKAFTISFNKFKNTALDEIQLSKKFCKNENIKLNSKYYNEKEIIKLLPDFFKNMEQPTIDGLNNYLVSKLLNRNKIKIGISGTGADEIFCGYNTFLRAKIIYYILLFFPKLLLNFFSLLFQIMKLKKLSKIIDFLSSKNLFDIYIFLRSVKSYFYLFDNSKIRKISSKIYNSFDNFEDKKINKKISYYEIVTYQRNQLLRDLDWAGMSNSVEIRVPFIDKIFLKQINSVNVLASHSKKKIVEKYLNYIPNYILNKKKTGFSVPNNKILKKFNNKYKTSYTSWSDLSINEYKKQWI